LSVNKFLIKSETTRITGTNCFRSDKSVFKVHTRYSVRGYLYITRFILVNTRKDLRQWLFTQQSVLIRFFCATGESRKIEFCQKRKFLSIGKISLIAFCVAYTFENLFIVHTLHFIVSRAVLSDNSRVNAYD